MTVDGKTTEVTQTVQRPDKYTAAQKKLAQNTVNVYQKPEAAFDFHAVITPIPQTNSTIIQYTRDKNLQSTGKKLKVTFDTYTLKDGQWKAGVPAAASTWGNNLMTTGSQYITDMFPILSMTPNQKGDITLGYTLTGNTLNDAVCGVVNEVECTAGGTKMMEWQCVYQKMSTKLGGHKFVALTVPDNLCSGATGFAIANKVFMAQYGTGANAGTIAHEVGHIYGISTANNPNDGHRNDSNGVEGFQVRTQTNRSYTENPTDSVSLMHTTVQPSQWVHNNDYTTLIGTVNSAVPEMELSAAGPFLIASGYINQGAGSASLTSAFLQDVSNDDLRTTGACKLELKDAANTVLTTAFVNPGLTVQIQKEDGSQQTITEASATGDAYFSASLPWNNNAKKLVISCGSTVLKTVNRSANAPSIALTAPADGTTLSGLVPVTWTGSDLDGGTLQYQLQFSEDDGLSWIPLTILSTAKTYNLDTTLLPAMDNAILRVLATDGLNTSYASRAYAIRNDLILLGSSPSSGQTGVGVSESISLQFNSDLNQSTILDNVYLEESSTYLNVPVNISYDNDTRKLTITPISPLRYNTGYEVILAYWLSDTVGDTIAYTNIAFTTVKDTFEPWVVKTWPASGEEAVSNSSPVQVQFNEPIDETRISTANLRLEGPGGTPLTGTLTVMDQQNLLFMPAVPLATATQYQATVLGVKDLAGNTQAAPYSWSFTTAAQDMPPQTRVLGNFIDHGVDTNGDGFYDTLAISMDVYTPEEYTYNLNARLLDGSDKLIGWQTSGDVWLAQGFHTLTLEFDSTTIRAGGMDGPYLLDAVNFYDTYYQVFDTRYKAYHTFPYDQSDFYAMLSLGGMPDQLLEWNTTRADAFNLKDYTQHSLDPLSTITYSLFSVTNPEAGVSIDADANIDIAPTADKEIESDVTVKAQDGRGNSILSTFHVSVQKPRASLLKATYQSSMKRKATQQIAVDIYDQWDRILALPTTITLEATLGSVPASVQTSNGHFTFDYTAGSTAGPAFITLSGAGSPLVITIDVQGMNTLYLPAVRKQ